MNAVKYGSVSGHYGCHTVCSQIRPRSEQKIAQLRRLQTMAEKYGRIWLLDNIDPALRISATEYFN